MWPMYATNVGGVDGAWVGGHVLGLGRCYNKIINVENV